MAREGKRLRTEHLELRSVASPLPHPRIGFIVARHRQSAVARNRLKRRLRELARTRLLPILPPVDLVIRSRPEAYRASFEALGAQFDRALDRLLRTAASS